MHAQTYTVLEFLRQMAFWRKTSNWFRKSTFDLLLAMDCNYWCFSRSYKVVQRFSAFSFWPGIPHCSSFGDFEPLKKDCDTLDTQNAHLNAKSCLLSHRMSKFVAKCGILISWRNKQKNTKKRNRSCKKKNLKKKIKTRMLNCTFHPQGKPLP